MSPPNKPERPPLREQLEAIRAQQQADLAFFASRVARSERRAVWMRFLAMFLIAFAATCAILFLCIH